MGNNEHYKKLEHMYSHAKCNEYYNPILTISEGTAELAIEIQDKFFHSGGATHGSVYFKALDDAAFFAVSSIVKDVFVLTVSFNIYLLRPISWGKMRANGKVVFSSGTLFMAESIIFDSEGHEIARGNGNFSKSKTKLSPKVGYK